MIPLNLFEGVPKEVCSNIHSHLTLGELSAFSMTSSAIRNNCNEMHDLTQLFTSALRLLSYVSYTFRGLKRDFDNLNNVYIVTLEKSKGFNQEALPSLVLKKQQWCKKEFICTVGYVVERNEYFYLEDSKDVTHKLAQNQFMFAIRYGSSIPSNPNLPEDISFLTRAWHRLFPPTSAVCDHTFPAKEVVCVFAAITTIHERQKLTIKKAEHAANAFLEQYWSSLLKRVF